MSGRCVTSAAGKAPAAFFRPVASMPGGSADAGLASSGGGSRACGSLGAGSAPRDRAPEASLRQGVQPPPIAVVRNGSRRPGATAAGRGRGSLCRAAAGAGRVGQIRDCRHRSPAAAASRGQDCRQLGIPRPAGAQPARGMSRSQGSTAEKSRPLPPSSTKRAYSVAASAPIGVAAPLVPAAACDSFRSLSISSAANPGR